MEDQWVAPTETELKQIQYYEGIAARDTAKNEQERRRYDRKPFAAEITGTSATNFFMGFSEDVSEGGLFLSTMSPPAIGEVVELLVKVSEQESFLVEGVVRWHREVATTVTGCGIQFRHVSPAVKMRFEQLLLDLQKEPLFFEL